MTSTVEMDLSRRNEVQESSIESGDGYQVKEVQSVSDRIEISDDLGEYFFLQEKKRIFKRKYDRPRLLGQDTDSLLPLPFYRKQCP